MVQRWLRMVLALGLVSAFGAAGAAEPGVSIGAGYAYSVASRDSEDIGFHTLVASVEIPASIKSFEASGIYSSLYFAAGITGLDDASDEIHTDPSSTPYSLDLNPYFGGYWKGAVHLSQAVDLYALAGVSYTRIDKTFYSVTSKGLEEGGTSSSSSLNILSAGAGMSWQLRPALTLNAQFIAWSLGSDRVYSFGGGLALGF